MIHILRLLVAALILSIAVYERQQHPEYSETELFLTFWYGWMLLIALALIVGFWGHLNLKGGKHE